MRVHPWLREHLADPVRGFHYGLIRGDPHSPSVLLYLQRKVEEGDDDCDSANQLIDVTEVLERHSRCLTVRR
jgi:hypothetical protein